MRLLRCGVAVAVLLASACQAECATRAYVMNGLIAGPGLAKISDKLRSRGDIVELGSYGQVNEFAADACAHRGDHIVVVGHSLGATAAAIFATQVRACGAHSVTMVSIDPPRNDLSIHGIPRAVNFVGSFEAPIAGAHNIAVKGFSHMGILEDPGMQARIISAAE
jgi:hypothetical protein